MDTPSTPSRFTLHVCSKYSIDEVNNGQAHGNDKPALVSNVLNSTEPIEQLENLMEKTEEQSAIYCCCYSKPYCLRGFENSQATPPCNPTKQFLFQNQVPALCA